MVNSQKVLIQNKSQLVVKQMNMIEADNKQYMIEADNKQYLIEKVYWITSVSYTHLDVYKRQVLLINIESVI